ncbi:Cytochrome P450 4C1 [Folsomia candida]|uniref:Cytochrome P450 4C1 n=1 Tax=Folsomia candida TaxID=158441 RepID=A0A226E8D8_FOLCA|nr:Cytochrome P450 4C1 [Folsomia candida]
MQFLKKEVEFEDQRALVQSGFSTLHVNKKKKDCHNKLSNQEDIPTGAGLFVGQGASCVFCGKSNHRSTECYRAEKNLSWSEKSDILKKNRLCFRCMLGGHRSKDCKVKLKCNFCEESHVRSMCPTLPINQKKIERRNEVCHPNQNQATVPVTSAQNANHTCRTDVLMKTLVVRVLGPKGSKVVRLIFDEGSQQSTGGQAIIKKVGSELVGEEWARNVLFGGTLTAPRKVKSFNVKVQSLDGKHTREILMREAPTICGDIARIPVGPWMKELKRRKIWLTDFENTIVDSQDVEILIGSDYWGQLVVGKPVLLECGLVAVDTIFGWTLSGPIYGDKKSTTAMMGISQVITESSVQDLWNLETIGITDPSESKSREECEEAARQHFLRTVSKSENGRYTVTVPWLDGAPEIPGNKSVAEKRLVSTTNKLRSQGQLENYDKIFSEWEKEGFIDEVKVDSDSPCHYLPHRAVIKPESQTTPVRPVFDASCKVGRSPSLNDCLEKGPNLLELIPAILLRFRKKKIGVISDVRKAFQMIQVAEKDQDYQPFLWWKNMETKEIKILRHKRVVFGVNCSPFLLGAVIEFHLKSVSEDLRLIALQLLHSLYVDNSVTSVDSHQEREDFEKACVMMMAEAGMELRQWEHSSVIKRGRQDFTTVLGLTWDKEADELFVEIPKNEPTGKMTKRLILSQIQKIFDPLGFVCPATLIPKRLLQKTWQDKKSWDEELEDSVKKEFIDWWKEVSVLEKIGIPRWAFNSENANNVQLHVFSDASKLAYAAVIFARIEGEHGVSIQLLQAKARIAPLKPVTIPRLELLGCSIAARLVTSVIKALSIEGLRIVCWSDSTTALAWIKRNDQWGTFVGNRVKEICSLTKAEEWRHVPGLINPADLPSRGCTPSQLLSSKWWEGPGWLKGPEEEWPLQEASPDEEEILAEKKKAAKIVLVTTVSSLPWYMEASPSFHKNVRVLAYIMRAIRNRFKKNAAVGLQEWELSEAEKFIFMEEQKVFESSVVDGLQVEQDHDGLLRVKTKILNLPDTDAFRKPVLLPKNSLVVDQLIRTEHLRNKHAGLQIMMSKLREKVWIPQSRQAIKKVLSRCTVCRRFTSKKCEVPCAPLPEARVKLARVFQVIGIDLAGPLFLKTGEKVWMVLYTCAVYRAVHLEIVTRLTAEEFLLSLHRFISRRGRPSIIYTDNGTNFEGASNAINLLDWERIQQETKVTRIEWKFIVPSSPWWGGFWERLIRSCKDLLKRMLGPRKLHLKELETCMFEVEAVINSRPLTYISEDKDDLVPLTPAMFLQDNLEVEFPEEMALNLTRDQKGNGMGKSVNKYLYGATMDFITEAAFGQQSNYQVDVDIGFFEHVQMAFDSFRVRVIRPWLNFPIIWDIFGLGKQDKIIVKYFDEFSSQLIAKRRAILQESEQEIEAMGKTRPFVDALIHTKSNKDITAHLLTVFGAGFETTANGMNFTLFLLAQNPVCQRKVHEELDAIFGNESGERDVSFADLAELTYLEMCIKESLRIFPPAPVMMRDAVEDIELDNGQVVPKGCGMVFIIPEHHRDPKYFPNPDKFDPDRFLPEECVNRHPYAYIPFSAGPRNCIGMKYAKIQMKTCLAHILRKFKVTTQQKYTNRKIVYGIVLETKPSIEITLVPRE